MAGEPDKHECPECGLHQGDVTECLACANEEIARLRAELTGIKDEQARKEKGRRAYEENVARMNAEDRIRDGQSHDGFGWVDGDGNSVD